MQETADRIVSNPQSFKYFTKVMGIIRNFISFFILLKRLDFQPFKNALWILFLCLVVPPMNGQEVILSKNYAIEQGLEERRVWKVIRDDYGKFWVFNNSSIQLFDGNSFFGSVQTPEGFRNDKIQDVQRLEGGNIGLTYDLGSEIYELNVSKYTLQKATLREGMHTIFDGHFYCLDTSNYLRTYTTEGLTSTIQEIHPEDSVDFFLYGGEDVLVKTKDKKAYIYTHNQRQLLGTNIDQIIGRIDSSIILRKDFDQVVEIDINGHPTIWEEKYFRAQLRHDELGNSLLGLSNNFRRMEKLLLFSEGGETLDLSHIIDPGNTIIDFYSEDFSNHILFNTYNGLLYKKLNKYIDNYHVNPDVAQGMFGNLVSNLFYRKYDDKVYFSKEISGLITLDKNGKIEIFPNAKLNDALFEKKFYYYDEIQDVLYSVNGIDSMEMQVYSFAEDRFTNTRIPFKPLCVSRLDEDHVIFGGGIENPDPKILTGKGRIGTYQISTGTFNFNYPVIEGDVYDVISRADNIYLATTNGLLKGKNHQLELSSFTCIYGPEIPFKYFYPWQSYLLCGTYGNGIFILQNDSLVYHMNREKGLSDDNIASIHYDAENHVFWIGTFKGISVIDTSWNVVRNFYVDDGMSENETNSFAFCEDASGKYYFGTINGITSFYPDDLLSAPNALKVNLSELNFFIDGAAYSMPIHDKSEVQLSYGLDSLGIYYKTYNYSSNFLYKDWTKGYDFSSSFASDKIIVGQKLMSISSPRAGTRSITIKNRIGAPEEAISLKVTIQHFWQKYMTLGLLTLILAVSLAYIIILRKNRKTQKALLETTQLNNQINRLQMASLRSQMNPHFIFNALGSIQYYIEKAEIDIANDYLSDFASLMRLILESSQKESIDFRQEKQILELYLKLEHLRFDEKFDYELIADNEIEFDFQMPTMIIQPFIENAINHGLYHLKERKGKLKITFQQVDEDHIKCVIEDNGVGREESQKLRRSKHVSRGMQIVKERIQALKSSGAMEVSLDIEDQYENQNPVGTKIQIDFIYQ